MQRKVFVEGPKFGIDRMFEAFGWSTTNKLYDADLVQFTGGADINPALYGEQALSCTHYNAERDQREIAVFKLALANKKPMAGICRGGQFLNVMCGGKLYQDIDNHSMRGTHNAWDPRTGEALQVTSTHHQEMIPTHDAIVCLLASEANVKEKGSASGHSRKIWNTRAAGDPDVEACYYSKQNAFCFQGHPEYTGHPTLSQKYMEYVDEFCFNRPPTVT